MKNGSERRVTLAGRKIRKMLARTKPRPLVTQLAKDMGVRRVDIYRLINGERWRHYDVNLAVIISDASKGHIEVADFMAVTAVPLADVEEEEDEEPRRLRRTGTEG